MRRPEPEELDLATGLLGRLAHDHGLSNLRHGSEPGELVADVGGDRTYFDVVAFEDDVEARLGWRPAVVPSGAAGARPGSKLERRTHAA